MKIVMLRFLAALLLTVLCFTPALADNGTPVTSQPSPGVTEYHNLMYVPGGDPAQCLDLYVPTVPTGKPLPIIVCIHGGGWSGGSKDWCPSSAFVGQGYAAASIEYRFSQVALFPAQIQDCQAAIRWLRANSKTYNIDPKHIGVWGYSAGGHLVALLGTAGGKHAFPPVEANERESDRVQAVCDEYGPVDFNTVVAQAAAGPVQSAFNWNHGDPLSTLIGVPLGSDQAKTDAVSPIHYVSHDNPPFLILHGTSDNLVPFAQSVEFEAALQKAHVDVLLQPFPGAGHGGGIIDSNPPVTALVKAFFDKTLRKLPVPVELLPTSEVTQ
jgi:acetyl esterase/lipase